MRYLALPLPLLVSTLVLAHGQAAAQPARHEYLAKRYELEMMEYMAKRQRGAAAATTSSAADDDTSDGGLLGGLIGGSDTTTVSAVLFTVEQRADEADFLHRRLDHERGFQRH
jgi:hypothetical protein